MAICPYCQEDVPGRGGLFKHVKKEHPEEYAAQIAKAVEVRQQKRAEALRENTGDIEGVKLKTEPEHENGKTKQGSLKTATVVKFVRAELACNLTPIMTMGRQAAINEFGWPPDITLEDFLDTVLYHFFKDRGITLQGYIVDEELLEQEFAEGNGKEAGKNDNSGRKYATVA